MVIFACRGRAASTAVLAMRLVGDQVTRALVAARYSGAPMNESTATRFFNTHLESRGISDGPGELFFRSWVLEFSKCRSTVF